MHAGARALCSDRQDLTRSTIVRSGWWLFHLVWCVTAAVRSGPWPDLTTPRLVLRPLTAADTEALHAIWTSAGVRRFLWDDEIIPIERTRASIELNHRLFAEHRYGLWGARPAGTDDLIGFGGLWPFRDPPELELVYGIADALCGHGYATEIARAVVAYCFDALDMAVVRASTDIGNTPSAHVLEKLRFRRTRRAFVAGLDTAFYELPRDVAPSPSV
jgi:ribosomal-protein-alanine N-acetyltransferase